jgi:anti-sigma-K factor RskA
MNPDVHTLAGAYALDALGPEERLEFEAHLAECPACRADVVEFTATAAQLGAVEEVPPDGLRARVLAKVSEVRQLPPLAFEADHPGGDAGQPTNDQQATSPDRDRRGPRHAARPDRGGTSRPGGPGRSAPGGPTAPPGGPTAPPSGPTASPGPARDDGPTAPGRRAGPTRPSRQPRRWATWVASAAAAVLLVVTGGLVVINQNLRDEVGTLEARVSDVNRVLSAPDAQAVSAPVGDGRGAVVVSRSLGQSVFAGTDLPPTAEDQTYQLWYIGDDGIRSAGTFMPGDDGDATQLLDGEVGQAGIVGVSVEPAGGSEQPTTTPVLAVELPPA